MVHTSGVSKNKNPVDVSICIPTYNRPQELDRLLGHIEPLSKSRAVKIEIVVVNNGPKASLAGVEMAYKNVTFLHNAKNIGLEGSLRRSISYSRSTWVWLLADDDEPRFTQVLDAIERADPSVIDHILFHRSNSSGEKIDEDWLQKTVGFGNNVFHSAAAKSAIEKLEVEGLQNHTYPQVIIALALSGACLQIKAVAYVDSQPTKNYSLESAFRVQIRDVLQAYYAARILRPRSAALKMTQKWILSSAVVYTLPYLGTGTSGGQKSRFRWLLKHQLDTKKGVMQMVFGAIRAALFGASKQPAVFRWLVSRVAIISKRSWLIPMLDAKGYALESSAYFGYDPEN